MTAGGAARAEGGATWLAVKVVPGASRDRIVGWLAGAVKVQVACPPERGRANERLCALLARALGVPGRDVQVVRGATAPRKLVAIAALPPDAVVARLAVAIGATP